MKKAYAVFFRDTAFHALPRSARDRNAVLRFIESLGENPFQHGDYEEKDEVGRAVQGTLVGKVVVTWWPDHAVSEVKVLKIEAADRSR